MEKDEIILKERAKIFSKKDTLSFSKETIEALQFYLDSEDYAIETHYIQEVYPLKEYTSLPGAPPFVFGLINIRRHIYPIFDLRVFFDIPINQEQKCNKVILLANETDKFAIVINQIQKIFLFDQNEIQPPPPTLIGVREEFLKGITEKGVAILDAQKILNDGRFIVEEVVNGD